MEIKFYLLLTTVLFYWSAKGQDTLLYKSGKRVGVTIVKETTGSVYVRDFKESSGTNNYTVKKKNLNGILYQSDDSTFSAMTTSDFYKLGEKHAKEFGTPFNSLVDNPAYMNGFAHKIVKKKLNTYLIVFGSTIVIFTTLSLTLWAGDYPALP